jgi:transposase-like protein
MDSMGKRDGGPPRKAETAATIRQASQGAPPDKPKRPTRRRYDAAFKLRVLRELDALSESGEPGALGAFLRREGLTWSHAHRWRKEREEGGLVALGPKKRGPKTTRDAAAKELERLRRQNERLQNELRKAEIIIDVQKKLAALLGTEVPAPPAEEES